VQIIEDRRVHLFKAERREALRDRLGGLAAVDVLIQDILDPDAVPLIRMSSGARKSK